MLRPFSWGRSFFIVKVWIAGARSAEQSTFTIGNIGYAEISFPSTLLADHKNKGEMNHGYERETSGTG